MVRGRPLGQARLLYEVGPEGIDVRALRERLKLDSGYLSRLLRSLEAQGLVQTDVEASDGRVRRVVLTPKGVAERATYNALSNDLAWSFLEPLDSAQRDRLVRAMAEVERLLRTGAVDLRAESPDSIAAQWCLGIARRVLRWLETKAREAGLTRLRLETNRTLTEAQVLYRAEGYQEVEPFNAEPYAHHWFEKRL